MRGRLLVVAALLSMAAGPAPPEPDGFRMDDYRGPVPATLRGASVLDVEAMRDVVARRAAVLIDVLPAPRRPEGMRPGAPWMPQPHRSLPASLWWPDVGRGALPPRMEAHFRRRLQDVAGDPPRLVVFFCLSNCWMSWNAAKRAAAFGLPVGWFPDGVDGWEAAGLPVQIVEPEWLE